MRSSFLMTVLSPPGAVAALIFDFLNDLRAVLLNFQSSRMSLILGRHYCRGSLGRSRVFWVRISTALSTKFRTIADSANRAELVSKMTSQFGRTYETRPLCRRWPR